MRAASSLVNTFIAEPPVPLVALVAFPVTFVCQSVADVTEESRLQPVGWIVASHLYAPICRAMDILRGS
jgi:hypothetical protein